MNQIATAGKRVDSRTQILDAARELVNSIEYSVLTMKQVADHAGVSRATLYRYYSTKEELYSDVTFQWGQDFVQSVHLEPPVGQTVGQKLSDLIDRAIAQVVTNPNLMAAHIAVISSENSKLKADRRRLRGLMPSLVYISTGDRFSENIEMACTILQHVLIANLILMNAGKTERAQIVEELQFVAKKLLSDVWDLA